MNNLRLFIRALGSERRFIFHTGIFLMTVMSVLLCSPTHGQGSEQINPGVPNPISSRDLDRYATRLNLSTGQQQLAASYHSEYLAEFEFLREREIEDVVQRFRTAPREMMRNANVSEMRDVLQDARRMLDHIRALDEQFFNRIETLCSEEQMQIMPQVTKQRERDRYGVNMLQFMGGGNPALGVALSDLLLEMDLDPEETATMQMYVAEYETSLTGKLRDVHEGTLKVMAKELNDLHELGITEDSLQHREISRQWRESMWGAMRSVRSEITEQSAGISEFNLRTCRLWSTILTEDTALDFRWDYYQRVYSRLNGNPTALLGRFDAALELPEITDEQREAIEAEEQAFIHRNDSLADDMIDLIEEQRSEDRFARDREKAAAIREELDDLQQRVTDLHQSTLDHLDAMLGPDLAQVLDDDQHRILTSVGSDGKGDGDATTRGGPGRGGGGMQEYLQRMSAVVRQVNMPGPISKKELKDINQRLMLDDSTSVMLDMLYQDYLENYETWKRTELEPLRKRIQDAWRIESSPQDSSVPSDQEIEQFGKSRQNCFQLRQKVDKRFFDNIEVLISDEEYLAAWNSWQRWHEREMYRRLQSAGEDEEESPRGPGRGMFGGGSELENEARVDLIQMLDDIQLEAVQQDLLSDDLSAYESELVDSLRKRYEMIGKTRIWQEMMIAQQFRQRAGEGRPSFDRQRYEQSRQLQQDITTTTNQIQQLNRNTMQDIEARIAEVSGDSISILYYQVAFPEVYEDPTSAEPWLEQVMSWEDINEAQRQRLADIAAEYHAAYNTVNTELLNWHLQQSQSDSGERRSNWEQRMDQRSELARIHFDRDDLNHKTMLKIEGLLTEQQSERLPDPPAQ